MQRTVSKDGTCGRDKERKKETFMRQTRYLPRPPRSHSSLKFCMRGRVRVVIYFKFHENQLRGLGAVGGRKVLSPIDLAHSLYTAGTMILIIYNI